jgi:hypothetical protein
MYYVTTTEKAGFCIVMGEYYGQQSRRGQANGLPLLTSRLWPIPTVGLSNRTGEACLLRSSEKISKNLDLFVTTTHPLRSPPPFNMSFHSTFLEDVETYSFILKDGEPFYQRQESKIPELCVILREKFPKVKRVQQCAPIATKSSTLPTRCCSELCL